MAFDYSGSTHVAGKLLLFFAVFFTSVGSFFAVHLAVFVAITPSPKVGVTPWNFGGYAYPNYPNSKIGMFPYAHTYAYIVLLKLPFCT